MTLPTRLLQAVRPQASPGVMAGAAVVAATFAATPFLLPDISANLAIDIGTTGLISTAQVGSFAIASFLAGRILTPTHRLHVAALGVVALGSVGSAFATSLLTLIATRVLAGIGLGAITWIAWADATRFLRGLGEVAAVAPLTAAIASPILGSLVEIGGYRLVFLVLAVAASAAMTLSVDFGELPRVGRHVSSSKSNRMLLAALLILSIGGSSVFIFTGAMAQHVQGLSPVQVSWALSINAVTGVLATRVTARRGSGGMWMIGTVIAALAVGNISSGIVFYLAMALWGFAFWMAVPATLRMLTERSLTASERMGDAQAAMASGRIFGPIVGGIALGAGQFGWLSVVGASIMMLASVVVMIVELYLLRRPSWSGQSQVR